jgi:hypothetical protein
MTERSISRREFITSAAAVGILAGGSCTSARTIGATLSANAVNAEPILKLGVASYSLRNFPREQAIEMTRSLGVRYINFKSVHLPYDASPAEFAAARAQLAAAGLELVGGG